MKTISETVREYKRKINESIKLPFRRKKLDSDSLPSRFFALFLLRNSKLFFDFLSESGLIVPLKCPACSQFMSRRKMTKRGAFAWVCDKLVNGSKCDGKLKDKGNSWFSCPELSLEETFILTYEVIRGTSLANIVREYDFSFPLVLRWSNYVKESIVKYMEASTQPIGGEGTIVEINETLISPNMMNSENGQWVFGGVERETGRLFLEAVEDRTAKTLISLIKKWILPGTTIISDCWGGYSKLSDEGYEHLTVSHRLQFAQIGSGIHINTILCTWRHFKASIFALSGQATKFDTFLADFMFYRLAKNEKEDPFVKFLEIIRSNQSPTNNFNEIDSDGTSDVDIVESENESFDVKYLEDDDREKILGVSDVCETNFFKPTRQSERLKSKRIKEEMVELYSEKSLSDGNASEESMSSSEGDFVENLSTRRKSASKCLSSICASYTSLKRGRKQKCQTAYKSPEKRELRKRQNEDNYFSPVESIGSSNGENYGPDIVSHVEVQLNDKLYSSCVSTDGVDPLLDSVGSEIDSSQSIVKEERESDSKDIKIIKASEKMSESHLPDVSKNESYELFPDYQRNHEIKPENLNSSFECIKKKHCDKAEMSSSLDCVTNNKKYLRRRIKINEQHIIRRSKRLKNGVDKKSLTTVDCIKLSQREHCARNLRSLKRLTSNEDCLSVSRRKMSTNKRKTEERSEDRMGSEKSWDPHLKNTWKNKKKSDCLSPRGKPFAEDEVFKKHSENQSIIKSGSGIHLKNELIDVMDVCNVQSDQEKFDKELKIISEGNFKNEELPIAMDLSYKLDNQFSVSNGKSFSGNSINNDCNHLPVSELNSNRLIAKNISDEIIAGRQGAFKYDFDQDSISVKADEPISSDQVEGNFVYTEENNPVDLSKYSSNYNSNVGWSEDHLVESTCDGEIEGIEMDDACIGKKFNATEASDSNQFSNSLPIWQIPSKNFNEFELNNSFLQDCVEEDDLVVNPENSKDLMLNNSDSDGLNLKIFKTPHTFDLAYDEDGINLSIKRTADKKN